ncbi:MAG TPA: GTP cyclohydrolase II [Candidatus Thalassarchaeaceae archaeon]|nr:MAG TPA: GTP cyclohydrolase II [Candidatus Poseidoniales archaeon]HIH84858.1 GTP cyclohydrolase II [Candidatus Thalassarchaeaceae archaeon]|tara:strand:+ start:773 stop:1390 length:618 start_codon:yes stop_codon:yes gene_type:complete
MVLTKQQDESSRSVRADAHLPTEHGNFRVRAFPELSEEDHCVIYTGQPGLVDAPLVRIHSECLTGDAFSSLKCDCGPQLKRSLEEIQKNGTGMVIYLRQEGRGIGLSAKIQAYALQDRGYDTLDANLLLGHPADARDYTIAAQMLKKMNVSRVRLMTNNPLKYQALEENGIEVIQRIEHIDGVGPFNREYLSTKAARMGHLIDLK